VGIGAAIALNVVDAENTATIDGGAHVTANGVTVEALVTDVDGDTTNTFDAEATSGASGGKIGVAGSVAINAITSNTSEAVIQSGAVVLAGTGDVIVAAANTSEATAKALPLGEGVTGGNVGVGASISLNLLLGNTTRA